LISNVGTSIMKNQNVEEVFANTQLLCARVIINVPEGVLEMESVCSSYHSTDEPLLYSFYCS
jgi:hypothetical protein